VIVRAGVVLTLLLVAARAAAQPSEPARLEPVVVTVTRIEQKVEDAPASVTVITREDVQASASQTVDDLLRQVPGFSLFRRSSSVVTHPTAQGVSLRGIGPSGASRVLVLVDGIPVNDPFGGWVYWSRMPMQSIEQIEVVRGGGSSVWGNGALGGVINVITRKPMARAAFFQPRGRPLRHRRLQDRQGITPRRHRRRRRVAAHDAERAGGGRALV